MQKWSRYRLQATSLLQGEKRRMFCCRTGTFLKTHNPVWAAKVFGRVVKNSVTGVPRPGWPRRGPAASSQAQTFSSRVSSAWKNRPPMPRPSYRLHHEEGKTIQHAYLDVAVFYLLFVRPLEARLDPLYPKFQLSLVITGSNSLDNRK